jgi:hypothetical protein
MRRAITIAIATLALTPGASLAETTAQGGYSQTPIAVPPGGDSGPTVLGASETNGAGTTAPSAESLPVAGTTPTAEVSDGSLPFTGLDVGIVAALAAALLALGFGLRRASRFNEA